MIGIGVFGGEGNVGGDEFEGEDEKEREEGNNDVDAKGKQEVNVVVCDAFSWFDGVGAEVVCSFVLVGYEGIHHRSLFVKIE